MTLSPFTFKNYRDYLWARVKDEKGRGGLSRVATAAKCQNSHITRVLRGDLQLTPDQAFRLARFWHLSPDEEAYFMKLLELERASDPLFRGRIQSELNALKQLHENLEQRLKRETIETSSLESTYYSAWYWSAIHIATSIPAYQTAGAIAAHLALPEALVGQCLKVLTQQGLVEQKGSKFRKTDKNLHLGSQSPMNSVQHANWRARAVNSTQLPADDGVHYTVVQSVSREDFEKIKQLILDSIDRYAKIANPSAEEVLACFLCDFFRVGQ